MGEHFSNHTVLNLITKGFLNTSVQTNGIIDVNMRYEIIDPDGSIIGSGAGFPTFEKIKKQKINPEEINLIKIYVNWSKQSEKWKKIQVSKINKQINVEILKMKQNKKHINVEIIEN